MATIKQRLERLEKEKTSPNAENSYVLIMLNDSETEDDAIARYGYDPKINLKKFIFVSWQSATK